MYGMRIEVYSACWNEEIMMPHFLRYYSQFADAIYLYDNESTDATLDIIAECPIAEVTSYQTEGEFRDVALIGLKNTVWKESKADYVIVADTDELVYHPDIRTYLEKNPEFDVFQPTAYHMVIGHVPSPEEDLLRASKMGAYTSGYSKMLLFKPTTHIRFRPGGHKAAAVFGNISHKNELRILHYRYFTLEHRVIRNEQIQRRMCELNKEQEWSVQFGFPRWMVAQELAETIDNSQDPLQPQWIL
jgi:hypothetical protein